MIKKNHTSHSSQFLMKTQSPFVSCKWRQQDPYCSPVHGLCYNGGACTAIQMAFFALSVYHLGNVLFPNPVLS